MMRLRATKFQRNAPNRGGSSETTQPPRRAGRTGAGARPGTATSAPPASTATSRRRRPLQRADVRGRVDAHRHAGDDGDAGGREPAAERAGDLERRKTSRAARRRARPPASRGAPPGAPTCSTAGGSASSRSRSGYTGSQRQIAVSPHPRRPPRAHAPEEAGVSTPRAAVGSSARAPRPAARARPRAPTGGATPRRAARRPPRSARSGAGSRRRRYVASVARVPARHAASASAWSSSRSDAARRMWSGCNPRRPPSRSATVRATRRMRPCPRAERRLRSCSSYQPAVAPRA